MAKTTKFFREQVLRKRNYLEIEWCLAVIADPLERVVQADGRIRFFGYVPQLTGKALRVVTLEDGETIHNAFPDSGIPESPSCEGSMKLNYDLETDSLYIDLASASSVDSQQIADGLVVDFDEAGHVVGLDIQHASKRLDLSSVETTHLPLPIQRSA